LDATTDGFAASVTSTISARRMPTLSVALNVTGSSPDRVPEASSPWSAVSAPRPGAVLSVIVTREPMTCAKAVPTLPAPSVPRLQAEPSSV
jgi:hypothetical protein